MYICQHNNNFLNHNFNKSNDRIFDLKLQKYVFLVLKLNETVIQIMHCLIKERTR